MVEVTGSVVTVSVDVSLHPNNTNDMITMKKNAKINFFIDISFLSTGFANCADAVCVRVSFTR